MGNKRVKVKRKSFLEKIKTLLAMPKVQIPTIIFLIVLILILPSFSSLYAMRVLIMLGFYMLLSCSLNLITGYLGEVSLGHGAFYAVGAYSAVLLVKNAGLNYGLAVVITMLLSALLGWILSVATLRVSGTYQCILTIAFFYLTTSIILNWPSVTNGAQGVNGVAPARLFGIEFSIQNNAYYYCIFIFVGICMLVTYLLINSRFGRAIKAFREDSLASTMVGINNQRYRQLVYAISGLFAGLAGALYGPFIGYLTPRTFTYDMCLMTLLIVLVGGKGTISGMIVGAIIISPLGEVLRLLTDVLKNSPLSFIKDPEQWRFVIYGVIMVVIMHVRPQGILGGLDKTDYRFNKKVKLPKKEASV